MLWTYPILILKLLRAKRKESACKPRSKNRPWKNLIVIPAVNSVNPDNSDATTETRINLLKLTSPATKFAIFTFEINRKVHKLTKYQKAVYDIINSLQWRQAVEKKINNLDLHNIWEYEELLSAFKPIWFLWVFQVKYHLDGRIARYKARLVV